MSWNIKTPGDYINGPLTVAGVTQFNSNVGVGIAPAVNFHVGSSGNTQFRIESTGTGAGATNRLQFKNASGASDVRTGVIEWYDVGAFKGDLRFLKAGGLQIRNSSDIATFNLDDSGNAGFGASPLARLHSSNGLATDSGLFTGLMIGGTGASSARTASLIKNTSGPYDLIIRTQDFTGTTTGSLIVQNGATEVFRVNSNAAAVLAGGNVNANGIGIAFPSAQSASTDANTLDDYEEGTWTPVVAASSGTATTVTIGTCKYTKIGRQVICTFDFTVVDKGTASGSFIFSLPFTSDNLVNCGAFRENGSVGNMGQVFRNSAGDVAMFLYNNVTVWVNTYRMLGTYTYCV